MNVTARSSRDEFRLGFVGILSAVAEDDELEDSELIGGPEAVVDGGEDVEGEKGKAVALKELGPSWFVLTSPRGSTTMEDADVMPPFVALILLLSKSKRRSSFSLDNWSSTAILACSAAPLSCTLLCAILSSSSFALVRRARFRRIG
jgi:hypothetical protein